MSLFQETKRQSVPSWAYIASGLALFVTIVGLLAGGLLSGRPLNMDSALFLHFGKLLLLGWMPYVDFVDFNPPVTHYVHALPVFLAGLLRFGVAPTFHLFIVILSLYSVGILFHLLSKSSQMVSLPGRLLIGAAWLGFSAVFMMSSSWFGSREHMFVLSYVPFLYCREARHRGVILNPAVVLLIGLLAAPFMLMKPYFCLIVACVEGWMLFRSRKVSTLISGEYFVVILVALSYGFHFLFIPTAMRDAFFLRWAPMAAENYQMFKGPIGALLLPAIPPWRTFMPAVLVLSVLVLTFSRKLIPPISLQLESLAVGILSSYAMYWWQGTGWSYQLHPAVGLGILLGATVLVLATEKGLIGTEHGARATVRVCLYAGLCIAIVVATAYVNVRKLRNVHGSPEWKGLCKLIEKGSAPCESVAFISLTSPYPAMAYADRLPGTRYLVGWPLLFMYNGVHRSSDGVFPYRKGPEMTNQDRRILDDIGNDMRTRAPRLVFIDRSETKAGFSVDQFLRQTGSFGRLMRGYALVASYKVWDVYRRTN